MNSSSESLQWRIRPACVDDVELIAEFNSRLALESEGKRLRMDVLTRGVRELLERADLGRYFLAEMDDQIIGQIMITFEWSDWRCGVFWWIQSVYVQPDHRRRGVFRSLFRHVESQARADDGVCGLRLYVERQNDAALATYEQMGMRAAGYHVYENDWSAMVSSA